jgi:predicted site-specific integrase-resolvase
MRVASTARLMIKGNKLLTEVYAIIDKSTLVASNKTMFVSIGKAAKEMAVHPETLRRWEKAGKIEVERTPTGRRLYNLAKLHGVIPRKAPSVRMTLAYARVSSHDQKEDLARQVALLESFCAANGWV